MLGNQRVLGVCVTRIQEAARSNYLSQLYILAKQRGMKLVVFNSFLDFRRNDAFDQGAMSVYDLMDYHILDAVIVLADAFADAAIVKRLVDKAKAKAVPVIVVNG